VNHVCQDIFYGPLFLQPILHLFSHFGAREGTDVYNLPKKLLAPLLLEDSRCPIDLRSIPKNDVAEMNFYRFSLEIARSGARKLGTRVREGAPHVVEGPVAMTTGTHMITCVRCTPLARIGPSRLTMDKGPALHALLRPGGRA
jgi:hypothetical protein